ncbi:MAG: hypothetical protein A2W11_08195 [Ignavibacteria bacterium RBG_16_35_7]|nr:MAG: hypothetical protein A2W11_08195 [Ignavibacteria bacterium RBG_16_35_7]
MRKTVLFVALLIIPLGINAQWIQQNIPYTEDFLAVHFVDSNIGWICGNNGLILHTTNAGSDWFEQVSGTNSTLREIEFVSSQVGWACGAAGILLYTANGGNSWETQQSGVSTTLFSISALDSENCWVAGLNGKILKTTDGGNTWLSQSYFQENFQIMSLYFWNSTRGWLGAVIHDPPIGPIGLIYSTTNGGISWNQQFWGLGQPLTDIFFVDENNGWGAVNNSDILITSNGGNDWIPKSFSPNYGFSSYRVILRIPDSGWIINYGNSNDIRFTSDGGNTWSIQTQASVRFFDIYFVEQKYGWAVGENGLLVHTTNGGGVFPSTPTLVSPINNQLLKSDTVNLIWRSATPLITGYSVNISTDSLFTTYTDTLITDTSLTLINLELNTKYYWRVKALNEIGWGDYSDIGSFTITITGIGEDYDSKIEFVLSQNYPNPFNPVTRIKYTVPSRQLVSLKVFDVLGREVITLVNEEKPAGVYEVVFNVAQLSRAEMASGVYYYQLSSENFVQTKKMIYLK